MLRVHLALVAVQILFGLWPVAGAAVLDDLSPHALIGVRTLVAAPILVLMFRPGLAAVRETREVLRLALLAALGVSANQLLFIHGLAHAGPVHAAVLGVLIPALTLVAAALLGREKPGRRQLIGIAIALAGALLLVRPDHLDVSNHRLIGSLYLLGNVSAYSLYLVLARDAIARHGAGATVAWIFVLGALEALPFTGPALLETSWSGVHGWAIGSLAFIVLGATVGTYALNAYALKRTSSSTVAAYVYLQPLISAVGARVWLGQEVSTETLVAGGVVCGGVALATLGRR